MCSVDFGSIQLLLLSSVYSKQFLPWKKWAAPEKKWSNDQQQKINHSFNLEATSELCLKEMDCEIIVGIPCRSAVNVILSLKFYQKLKKEVKYRCLLQATDYISFRLNQALANYLKFIRCDKAWKDICCVKIFNLLPSEAAFQRIFIELSCSWHGFTSSQSQKK